MLTCSLSIALVLSIFGTDEPNFESSQISSLAAATYKLLHTYETVTYVHMWDLGERLPPQPSRR
jgi:hypothetical protein